jgi:phosphoesterase RecJ-like protein
MKGEKKTGIWKGIASLKKKLEEIPQKITILTHVNPDGDAIGSSLALLNILSVQGHQCKIYTPNDYPLFLKWLPGNENIFTFANNISSAIHQIKTSDIIFFVDFNDIKRIKQIHKPVSEASAFITLIDHHPDPELDVNCIISDTSVSSTGELVFRLINKIGLKDKINKDIATCLFAAIMTDTGCFSYNSSLPETYEIVAALLKYGINKDHIYYRIYDNFSYDRMRLLGLGLNARMEYFPEYRTAMIWLSRDDLKKYNFQTGDSEGFVNYPLSIKGIRFSAFFIEKDDHIKVSFRSKGNFPVNKFSADYFNGGGHLNASGGESYETLAKTLDKFRKLLPHFKNELNNYDE